MIRATGRYFCDFLQSVDNIHLQMRFTYRKMKSPSMQVTDIDPNGATLIYRSNRTGFSKYLMGMFAHCVIFNVCMYTIFSMNKHIFLPDIFRTIDGDSKGNLQFRFESARR